MDQKPDFKENRGVICSDCQNALSVRIQALPIMPYQRRVVALLVQGKCNKEIAEAMGVTVRSVKNALTKTYRNLGVGSRLELLVRLMMR